METFLKSKFCNFAVVLLPTVFYLGMLSFFYSANSLNLLAPILIPVTFIASLILALITILYLKKIRYSVLKVFILLLPLLIFPIIEYINSHLKETVLEAENGPLFGNKLYLYNDSEFKSSETSLLGTTIRKGKYKLVNDEIHLDYYEKKFYQYDIIILKIDGTHIDGMEIQKYNIKPASH